jgi:hypothetical protein
MTDSCKTKKTLRGYFGLHHQDLPFLSSATDGVLEGKSDPVVDVISRLHSKPLNERYRLWLLKKSLSLKTCQNLGDRRCPGDPRESFIAHPDAILFSRFSREGVFQQPRLLATVTFGLPVIWVYSVLRV